MEASLVSERGAQYRGQNTVTIQWSKLVIRDIRKGSLLRALTWN